MNINIELKEYIDNNKYLYYFPNVFNDFSHKIHQSYINIEIKELQIKLFILTKL